MAHDFLLREVADEELLPFGKIPGFAHGDVRHYDTSAIVRYAPLFLARMQAVIAFDL